MYVPKKKREVFAARGLGEKKKVHSVLFAVKYLTIRGFITELHTKLRLTLNPCPALSRVNVSVAHTKFIVTSKIIN